MGVVATIPVLTADEAQRVVADLHAERAHWTTRNPGSEFQFHTLGAASYLDASGGQFESYQARARQLNPVLIARFGWLLERLRGAVSSAVGGEVRYDDRLARPGFHVYAYHPQHSSTQASIHYDLQYELIDWSSLGTPDTASQMSLTLALALPASGGGLLVWNLNRLELMRMAEDERHAHMRANRVASRHSYTVGSLAIHSGHQLHQIAPTADPQPDDQRITMQAHTLRVGKDWILYW
jgi:hypothetical protein